MTLAGASSAKRYPEAKKPRSIPISNGKDAGQSIEAQKQAA
jgi:hypothetical protein